MDANQILKRQNLRGLVKCKACNHYNGIRATACKNKSCSLSKVEAKPKLKPKINAIQLVSEDESQLFSVQIRDRDVDNRNFVSITDKIISSDASASIISRNAICYVDTCKYDSNDVNISCKHVKSSLESCSSKAKVHQIEEHILNKFQRIDELKKKLLLLHKESPHNTPLVQRINQRVFVVSCDVSLNFPIGLLHVVCTVESKCVRFCCSCDKVKVAISPIQGSLLDKDMCEHNLMLIMAIMSDLNLQKEFELLVATVKQFLSNSVDECHWLCDELASVPIATAYNELASTTEAATLVDNLDNIEFIQIPNALAEGESLNGSFFSLEQCDGNNFESVDMESIPIVENENNPSDDQLHCAEYSDGLELVNYQVQLMDQLNSSDQIEFNEEHPNTSKNQNNLSIDGIYGIEDGSGKTNDVVLYNFCSEDMLFEDLPLEVMETLENPMTSKDCLMQTDDESEHEKLCRSLDNAQFESYLNWLDSVIETMNLVLDFNNDGYPDAIKFSVPHLYFEILRTKFSVGTKKKRLPNQTTVIANGKFKNLTMFTWMFSNIKLIKYIFSTKTMELEVVRSFRKTSQNTFEYISSSDLNIMDDEGQATEGNNRKIRPTIYKTFLKMKTLENNKFQNKVNKQGLFVIEWIPNTLPISKYGEMRIKLQYGHMKNDTVLQ